MVSLGFCTNALLLDCVRLAEIEVVGGVVIRDLDVLPCLAHGVFVHVGGVDWALLRSIQGKLSPAVRAGDGYFHAPLLSVMLPNPLLAVVMILVDDGRVAEPREDERCVI